ncbi:MAG: AAA family ATPase [Candidatus Neomarinimicrobiota bacterium]|jgi:chromosome segregation protein|tara:strand:- start:531 stop:2600 length:2070 start_codon:yes stop_codon:yes gene_type:complete
MHISKLEVFGFKSFAKKQTVVFNDGITGIVGPNGCGKTNIVDAIRWVLGEQRTSRLRSSKMEDLIFNGTSRVKPLGFCEVYLTVENDKGLLPLEYNQVEVGRKLYRSGESEYFINKNSCRLKDIYNLFVDTGMSSDAYSVIELNMIEQILSNKDHSRRIMFEEAAGVNKYKSQRRSALKKFELNNRDLERIDDIIIEIEMQVKNLQLQLKRFNRHEKLSEKLQKLEIELAQARISDLEKETKPLESFLKKKNKLLDKNSSKQKSENLDFSTAKDNYLHKKEELDKTQKKVDQLTEKLLKDVQKKNTESSKGIDVLEGELQKKINQLNQFDKDYMKIISECDDCGKTVIGTDKKYEKLKKSIEDYKDKIQEYKSSKEFNFNKLNDSIKDTQQKIDIGKSDIKSKETDVNNAFIKMESIRAKMDSERFKKDDILYDIKNAEMKIAESKIRIDQIKEQIIDKFGENIKLKSIKNYNISDISYNVEKTKRSIEIIGPINWAVSDEYNEQNTRLQLLKSQRSDLVESEENLKDAIKKIDNVAKKQFSDTFNKIKDNFEIMFETFFLGGKGTIALSDTGDPLNSEITIFAQPPGKKNSSLRMLSAGEKSLTAIALLFAIYQYKPSPFCILDEIDAPLDDININKFTKVIKDYSKNTQFIMVTHNKLTMESTDCIYGVTSERKGISKVISIDFAEK